MATIQCAISGLQLKVPHITMHLHHREGYVHPIFYLPQKHLWNFYKRHCNGELTTTESYLAFLAMLNSTDHIKWRHPCLLGSSEEAMTKLVENNFKQLVYIISLTNKITIPSFKQPKFTVNIDNSDLHQIKFWIKAWANNIDTFKLGLRNAKLQESLQKTENKLSYMIQSGIEPERYAGVVASWASKAADFPKAVRDEWTRTIRLCFNETQMFRTDLSTLRAIKEYCESNIESGSIHSHALYKQLRNGISLHTNYLGMSTLALGYTIITPENSVNEAVVEDIINRAPLDEPKRSDYATHIEFIRANLAYKLALTRLNKEESNNEK